MSTETQSTKFFDQELPRGELYHYTSAEGLMGIVKNRTLWATSIEYLNDTREFRHGEETLEKAQNAMRLKSRGERRRFFDKMGQTKPYFAINDVFVCSLSEAGDLLSQWRGYTPNNCGFSIGFDPDELSAVSWSRYRMEMVRCAYSESEQEQSAKNYLEFGLQSWHETRTNESLSTLSFSTDFEMMAYKAYSVFIAASMKDHSFVEEKEWRLLGVCRELSRIRFRSGKSSLTPFIELKWDGGDNFPAAQPIRSITIGPCPTPELSKKSVELLLQSCGLTGVSVRNSKIPFRAW